ncbi:MAG: hypothetical protein QM757_19170 [Paludibaculum sp.]
MASGPLTASQVSEYHEKGYVLARGMFSEAEIDLLGRAAKEDRELDARAFGRNDGEGHVVRLSLWNHPGDALYGMFARCSSIVDSAERLLNDEVYHYHSKMIMKDARRRRRLGVASGLRLLVSERSAVSPICAAPPSLSIGLPARMAACR